jgi:hypothetical protein
MQRCLSLDSLDYLSQFKESSGITLLACIQSLDRIIRALLLDYFLMKLIILAPNVVLAAVQQMLEIARDG